MLGVIEGLINDTLDLSKVKANLKSEDGKINEIKINLPQQCCLKHHLKYNKDYSEDFVFKAACSRISLERLKKDIKNNLYENSIDGIEKWLKKTHQYAGGSLSYDKFDIGFYNSKVRGIEVDCATMNEGWRVLFFTWRKVAKELYSQVSPTGDIVSAKV
jgi:hypothetical protein